MITIYEKDGVVYTCGRNEETTETPVSDFFSGKIFDILKDATVFVENFQQLGLFFLKALNDNGYYDATMEELSYTENHKLERDTYEYILSSDNHAFYSISYNNNNTVVNLYEFKNLVPTEIEDLMKDFDSEYPVVAMYRAAIGVRSYAERATTISSCAYSHWKNGYDRSVFMRMFPEIDGNAEEICRNAYHGGLCYIQKNKSCITTKPGAVIDCCSLYPFIMKTRKFAIGAPIYGEGAMPEDIIKSDSNTFYVHFKAQFKLKKDHIPFLRTRCDKRHWQMEILESSSYFDRDGNEYEFYEEVDEWGEIFVKPITVELCLYKPELELFFEQYNVTAFEPIDYVYFKAMGGIFDSFVDEFYELKKKAKGKAERRIAKIMLNALSGRMSLKKDRKNCYLVHNAQEYIDNYGSFAQKEIGATSKGKYTNDFMGESLAPMIKGEAEITTRSASHIQIGAAITSEALVYMVRLIQQNYERFLYTDTDSIHFEGTIDDLKGVTIGNELGEFKVEHEFYSAIYFKEKVYTLEDKTVAPTVTWAGLPKPCQDLVSLYLFWSHGHMYSYEGGSEKLVELAEKLLEKHKDEYRSDVWAMFCHDMRNRQPGNLWKLKVPYTRRTVKSYKNYEFCTKTEWYTLDVMSIE